jgi:hypothetical protein
MKVEEIARTTTGDRSRVSARLIWEDAQRPDDLLWYEWPSSFENDVVASTEAALVAALPLALVNGERRIAAAEPVCAMLYDHLQNAIQLFRTWYPRFRPLTIEVPTKTGLRPTGARRAAICLSGGVDSLAALLRNHAALDVNHPERIRECVYMFGLNTYDFADGAPVPERVAWYETYGRRLQELCADRDLTLMPVASNVRSLYPDWETWSDTGQASALVPAAHSMPGRLHAITIAATGVGAYESSSGTEPALDPLYSSYSLDVRSVHGTMLRIDKVRTIMRDPVALAALRVCLTFDVPTTGVINCGQCEKCLRTMLALVVCDALDRAPTFPVRDVVPGMLDSLEIHVPARADQYRSLVEPLRVRGRADLADAVAAKVADFQRRRAPQPAPLLRRLFRV